MTYGLRVWDAGGNLTFDSQRAKGGLLAKVVLVSVVGDPTTHAFPQFAGRQAFVATQDGREYHGATVDYSLGYPRVTIPGWPQSTLIFIK